MSLRQVLASLLLALAPALSAQKAADTASVTRWSAARANTWYSQQPWLVGADYVPSDAINQFEMFQDATWNPRLNDQELALAEGIGMNTVRVFLQDQLYTRDPQAFTRRLDEFLAIAARHGIRPILVLFDSCWDPAPQPGPQRRPTPGVHNSGWVQSPGARELADPAFEPQLERYVHGVVTAFANDPRVLAWDVWNEPDNPSDSYSAREYPHKTARVNELLPKAFAWARAAHPAQPLTSGVWVGDWSHHPSRTTQIQLAESDIISFHNYGTPQQFEARVQELLPLGRPLLCTEYMARGAGSTFEGTLPIAKRYHVAAINWGLVAGKTQTWLPWDSWQHAYTQAEPAVWFHEVFRHDGTPYNESETRLLREMTGRGAIRPAPAAKASAEAAPACCSTHP